MYNYKKEKHTIFTEEGVDMLILIRANAISLLTVAGAAMLDNIIRPATGDTFMMLACVDFLVERGQLEKVYREGYSTQDQIYVKGIRMK